jgi:hypothetical protein
MAQKAGPIRSGVSSSVKRLIPNSVRSWIRESRRVRRRRLSFRDHLRQSDSFLIGHPKSGNTWVAYMLGIVVNRDRGGDINISNIGDFVPTVHHRDFDISRYEHLSSPRIFRNEAPLCPDMYPRTIYLVRDPRAALLSYYHHCVHDTGRTDWLLDSFVDEMLANGCIKELEPFLVRWDIQVEAWLERAERQPVLIVRYEDIKQNQSEALVRMAEFLHIDASPEIIFQAVERSGFSNMRNEEQEHGAESYAGEKGSKGFFVRKGKVDSWREEMSQDTIKRIEVAFRGAMKRVGYTI